MAAEFAPVLLQGEADGMEQTCDPEVIYQDVDKLRRVIARTDDEAGSYFRFGDDFSQVSEEDVEPELSDDEEEGEGEEGVSLEEEEEGGSNTVRLLKKCLRQNRRFQEMVRVRLALVTVHLKDIKEKMDNLESLKVNAETSSRVKNSLCLSSFLNTPYFVDDRGNTPPPNADVKMNLRSESFLTYHKLKNYRLFTDEEKPLRMNKDRELLQRTVVKMCLEQLMVPLLKREAESSNKKEKEAIRQQLAEMDKLSSQEVVQKSSMDEVNWDKVSMVAFGGERRGSECCQLWHSAASPLLNMGHWGKMEDKRLLELARVHGNRDWERIAAELQTSRSPVQCLLRYQTFLNLDVHKGVWSNEEDQQLAELVERFGARNWALIASELVGRTANQCLQRWTRGVSNAFGTSRKGKWTDEENELLERAVSTYGQQWVKVAKMIKTRNDRQCRERWVNVLSPEVSRLEWLEEEERKLRLLCKKHESAGAIKWSAVAKEMPGRTDAQCRRHYLLCHTHPTEAVKYVRRNKKQLLIEQRHRGMGRKAQDKLSGQITELAGEDIEDDLMPDREQAELQRFMDRTLLPPVGVSEHVPLPPPGQPQPAVTDNLDAVSTLPPYNVDSGRYGPCSLLALRFSSLQPQPGAADQARGSAGLAGQLSTRLQSDVAPAPDTLQSGERKRRRRRRKLVFSSSLSEVRTQTLMVYQEYLPIRSPPQPYSPLVRPFHPEFTPLRGTLVAPPNTPTPCFPPPARLQPAARPRPVLTQFYAVMDPIPPPPLPHQPLIPCQPPQSSATSTPSSCTDSLGELPTAALVNWNHCRSTSFFAASSEAQTRLLNMATTYSPTRGGFVAVPHAGDSHCFYSPYCVAMPPPLSSPLQQQPQVEPSTKAQVVDTQTDRQVDALRDAARSRELGTDRILAEVAPIFGLSFDPSMVVQVEQGSDDMQPTSLALPTLQPPKVICETTSVVTESEGAGREVSEERRRSALASPDVSSPKRVRKDGPLSWEPHQTQQEECSTVQSSAGHDVPSSVVARKGQKSAPEAAVANLPRRRTRSGRIGQLPATVQSVKSDGRTEKHTSPVGTSAASSDGPPRGAPTASGGPAVVGQVKEREQEVDVVDALRRCSFPSTQFSTLLQAMKVNTPLQSGGVLTRPPQTTPLLPPNQVTMEAFKRLQDYINTSRERLCEASHSNEATSEERPQLLLRQRFASLFAWPALTTVLGEPPDSSAWKGDTTE